MSTAELISLARRSYAPLLAKEGCWHVPSFTGASDAAAALALAQGRIVLVIAPGIPEADRLSDDLRILAREAQIHDFPVIADDDKQALGARLKTLAAIDAFRSASSPPLVIVAPAAALSSPVHPEDKRSISLRTSDAQGANSPEGGFSRLREALSSWGYERTSAVSKPGEYSIRGDIVDFWSPGDEAPVRAEFFGETLESLRIFDPGSQTTTAKTTSAALLPCREDDSAQPDNAAAPVLLDILPHGSLVIALEYSLYPEIPLEREGLALVYSGFQCPENAKDYDFQASPLPGFAELGAALARHPELFDTHRSRLAKYIEAARSRGALILYLDDLSSGFELPGIVVVTKSDRIFARRRTPRRVRTQPRGERIADFEELEPGEYVVHIDHGVGRYTGSAEITIGGKREEVFTLEYADGALLHVPASQAHLISRYVGVKGADVKLHKLGGKRWKSDCDNAKKAVADMASALLATQARREALPGFAYDVNCDGIEAFEAAFPYEETPDQQSAIDAVKADMAAPKPMDRLVCGDAGYGKTEVAMRAAFIAAMNSRQTVLLAPTTVLAEQHYETFLSRFDGTPVRIECMSRFQSSVAREATLSRLASGVCDIVIATHAILSGRAVFNNLGLVVIDEEQRFGVRHKEFLKRLRSNTDVLTLTATPIPRTLYLSMTGARDLSILRTPPRERVAVDTQVIPDSDSAIKSAIDAEIARGGQVYFLHNRVATINKVRSRIEKLCPKAKISLAHGQLDSTTLAVRIKEFEQGRSDILLSTTIVESGIDIPRANTILVDRADMFGLADLYQLRGRVGRSSRQGHAFLLLPPSGNLDSDARERLAALKRHGGLGGGFNLAVRDLELRGAGNLLGKEQSGHIAAVGFSLYCQLLKRSIAALKGEKLQELVDVRMNLDFIDPSPATVDSPNAASLPYTYIEDDSQRLAMLRRIAEASSVRAVSALAEEMQDRFGRLPSAALRFIRLAQLKIRFAAAKIAHVDVMKGKAVFRSADSDDVAYVEQIPIDKNADAAISALSSALSHYNAELKTKK